jgi:hypothetical protein
VKRLYHERPPQNQYVRVDYQWWAETEEARQTHTVQWLDRADDDTLSDAMPKMRRRNNQMLSWLNDSVERPFDPVSGGQAKKMWGDSVKQHVRDVMAVRRGDARLNYGSMMPSGAVAYGANAAGRRSGAASSFDAKASTAR